MTPCPKSQHLQQFLDDALSGPDEDEVTRHVERCDTCRQRLEQLSSAPNTFPPALALAARANSAASAFLLRLQQSPPFLTLVGRDTGTEDATVASSPAGRNPTPEWPRVRGYEILSLLGRGGMGIVYKARQLSLNRLVALKMILDGPHADAEQLARFRGEAATIATLNHPNVVQIHDIGEQDGRPYFAMELVEGGSLAQRIAGTPQDPQAAATLIRTLAQAVQAAHDAGIIHRDLKPANVLLQIADCRLQIEKPEDGSAPQSAICNLQSAIPKITDFGLAKQLAPDETASARTRTGQMLGSPSYMAPEQVRAEPTGVGRAVDIWSLGAMLYEMLTGRPPFRGAAALDTVLQVLHEEPVAPRRLVPTVPRDLETICLKCLAKAPERRYASAAALAADLGRFQAGEPVHARPAGVVERTVKWTRRHPASAGLIAASVAALVIGVAAFAAVTVAWRQERAQRALAQDRLRNSLGLTLGQLVQLKKFYRPDRPEMAYDRQNAISTALAFFRKVYAEAPSGEAAERRIRAQAAHGLGLTHFVAGDLAQAEKFYLEARAQQEALVREVPAELNYQTDLALTHHELGELYRSMGRPQDADAECGKALELFTVLPPGDTRLAAHAMSVAQQLFGRGKLAEALPWQAYVIQQAESMEQQETDAKRRATLREVRMLAIMTRAMSLMELGRDRESFPDWDRLIELESAKPPLRWLLPKACATARAGEHARAAEDLAEFARKGWLTPAALAQNSIGGPLAHLLVTGYADCRASALKDEQLSPAEREARAEAYARQVVHSLGKAREAGLLKKAADCDALLEVRDLAFLKERADFQEFKKGLSP